MGTLTHRAEQALLGAMLREPRLAARLDYLEPGDFASNQHRLVFTAIMTASRSGQWDHWRRAVEEAAGPEIYPQYLDELEAACPEPSHGPAYGVMVLEASARRDLLAHATDLADQAESLRYTAQRMIRAGGRDGHRSGVHAGLVSDVASAIRVHVDEFEPDSTWAVTTPPFHSASRHDAFVEETVLAALLQHYSGAPRVTQMLPPPLAFTDPLRRSIYRAILDLSATGSPVDALTVDWELARSQGALGRQHPGDGTVTDDLPSYVTRLASVFTAGKTTAITASLMEERLARGSGQARQLLQPPPHQPGQGPAQTRRM
jgi:replicative DNA helicase